MPDARPKSLPVGKLAVEQASELRDKDLKAVNTRKQPERVKPGKLGDVKVKDGMISATLKPASWNVIRLKVGR